MPPPRWIALACILAAIAGCGKKPAPKAEDHEALFRSIATAQARADEIFAARDTMKVIRGKFTGPGFPSSFEASIAGSAIRYLAEAEDRGELGSSQNRYYFSPGGRIFYYEDRGEEMEPRRGLPPISRLVQRSATFDSSGAPTWGRRLVDGVASLLPDSEAVSIRERSVAVVARALGTVP